MAATANSPPSQAQFAGAQSQMPPAMSQDEARQLLSVGHVSALHLLFDCDLLTMHLQKYQSMKNSGVPDTEPEMQKMRLKLHEINQRHKAQQQARQAQNPRPTQNGFQNGTQAAPSMPNGQSQPAPGAPSNPMAPSSSQSTRSAPSWVDDRLKSTLRHQMKAFQLLSRNAPLSADIQQAVFKSRQPRDEPPVAPDTPAQGRSDAQKQSSAAVQLDEPAPTSLVFKGAKTYLSPYDLLQKQISYDQHSRRENRPIIAAIMPPGVDIERVREERENIIYNRLMERRKELEKLDASQDSWDTSKSDTPEPDGSRKRRALIEYKMLGLLGKQRSLRQQISREMVTSDTLAMTANRSQYRRQKKHDIKEARFTEKLEKDQRSHRENKEKEKHNDWLNKIMQHRVEVQAAAEEQRGRMKKFGRLMMNQHQIIEKEEQRRVERTAKQRLQALKSNDEETYLKLLGQAKDSRISHLLKQTDSFLDQLAASVKQQQKVTSDRWGKKETTPEPPPEETDSEDEEGGKRVDYYEVAHRIKEEVKEQSHNLIGGSLKEYQLRGLQWMVSLYNNNLNGILADEMGLGKTIQTISLITYLIEKKRQFGPFLVIVPLSTLTNWNNEFEKWAPTVNCIVYKGAPAVRKQAQNQIRQGQFQVLLTTYEYIIKDRPVLSKIKWLHMIVDEGHRMKNSQSKLSSTITQYYQTRYRIILTGTPLQNNLPELWALLNFVLPGIFKSVKSFDEWFNTPFANTGGQDKMDLTEEEQILVIRRLHKVLRPFLLRRLKRDVEKDLPEKQERVIKCNFSALQAKLYRQLGSRNVLTVGDGKGGKTSMRGLSNMLMQLRKLCNHPFVFEEVEDQMNPGRQNNDMLWRTAGKFELLDRILPKFKATGHRVLMFFQMTQIMNIMEDFMRLRGHAYLRLDGSTKSEERSDLLAEFNEPGSQYFCFLLSTRAGGLGLNLQTADTVIIFDSDWNPFQDLQAQDRAHRIGQKNEVRILRLITSKSVEEKILERAQFKLDMDGKVIQAGKFDNKSSNEERDAMLKVMLESADQAEDLESEEMDDDDLNAIMIRNDDEMEIFQKLDRERNKDPNYGLNGRFPRLLGENELPDIYVNDDVPAVDEMEEIVGRGARERTRVKYDDGLTEEQWLEAVDNDDDSIEAAIARKQDKVSKRQTNKARRETGGAAGDSPLPSRDTSESPMPKKRGRKPNKRKADDISMDGDTGTPASSVAPQPKPKRPRPSTGRFLETLSPTERTALQDTLTTVLDTLDDLEEQVPDAEPGVMRSLVEHFHELPDRKYYPDYYALIKQPIAMEQIEGKIKGRIYQSLNEFKRDVDLLVANCRAYNEDMSELYLDAGKVEVCLLLFLSSLTLLLLLSNPPPSPLFHPPFHASSSRTNKSSHR